MSAPWTAQQERLLAAAQAVCSDAAACEGDHQEGVHCVDREALDELRSVVQEISDDVVKMIEAQGKGKGGKR